MERTRPNANFHPQIVQYTPAESSMLKKVPPFVRPSRSSLAFVRTNTSANLNFASSAPRAPRPAAPFPQGDPCFVAAGRVSNARLKARMRAETTSCWVESGGRSSSAWRHAARAALTSLACVACSASAARRLRSSEWTRRWQDGQADAREDARVGLAGPLWGLGAALAAYAVYRATGVGVWGAIAHIGALVNLFNLVPVWQLDGARGFRALTRQQRWIAVAVIALMWLVTSEGLLVLLGIAAVAAAGFGRAAEEPDHTALLQYTFLVGVLSLMTRLAVPATGP